MAVVKCTRLPSLYNVDDSTCMLFSPLYTPRKLINQTPLPTSSSGPGKTTQDKHSDAY